MPPGVNTEQIHIDTAGHHQSRFDDLDRFVICVGPLHLIVRISVRFDTSMVSHRLRNARDPDIDIRRRALSSHSIHMSL